MPSRSIIVHWQGGPGPAKSLVDRLDIHERMTRFGESWLYQGITEDRIHGDRYRFRHVALSERNLQRIQGGI